MKVFLLFFSAIFVNNFVLARFLGICPFLGVSKRLETATGMGIAVTFVMTVSAAISWFLDRLLIATGLEFLRTIVFILVIASFVQFVELFLKKSSPDLYEALGIFLPLITTNCAILGMVLLNSLMKLTFVEAVFHALGSGLGFALALVIFAGIREKLDLYDLPESFKGTAIALITAGLLSLAFMGFQGMVKL
ncbi:MULTISPECIES: electron transport complex subunit RsxA [Thermotoga]|jgi:electron transport complex protein RnfA|uniref:Ion-translocating oxidoreductase complex subunit A n=1 Tax=Thermotoga neapolitana (strain ATCC 49049 / DSM 4359 / NBRC 107923 / NS-E) TaxID=309803 RepID=B9K6N1_THENN|nr:MULTISPECIES: electron transport complex subunit RsxA [Thermotoga]MDK2785481.1 H+/Na+-translocating ferredoxin:NAD+ oxidoreductase subunit [Thermotoga sp.]HBF11045.1 electron transport complex subunit RsxA [Thermotoga neapolitana]ACM22614.1 Electron transport complex, RnfABCDGE type, A subunit [Thermotoga neapolitana DSM 4359]AJG40561.1 electron transporter RnfA [Thermotoga sp. RQ7]KFZ22253.1 Electron transport complex, RnfABCDGE type, A subunit [Thermotoga neapolitana LA10]